MRKVAVQKTCVENEVDVNMMAKRRLLKVSVLFLICAVFIGVCQSWSSEKESTALQSDLSQLQCLKEKSELFRILHKNESVHLGIDQAFVDVVSNIKDEKFTLCIQYEVCHNCALLEVTEIRNDEPKHILLNTNSPVILRVSRRHEKEKELDFMCQETVNLDEHGNYTIFVNNEKVNGSHCNVVEVYQPPINTIPIYVAIAVYCGLAIFYVIGKLIYLKGWHHRILPSDNSERLVNSDLGSPSSDFSSDNTILEQRILVPQAKKRLGSLDTFRGLSLVIMIFVNYRGGSYWFFHHSAWDGLTVADLVFPWFVFIMGTSIAIAFQSLFRRGMLRKKLLLKVIRRTVILFALGLLTSNRAKHGRDVNLSTLRIPGVLQRLALTYFAVALLEVIFGKLVDHQNLLEKWWAKISDLVLYWPQWLVAFALLLVYICITLFLPVPNCPTGYIGPGGLSDNASHINCTGGAAGYIDRLVFGPSHIYQHPTSTVTYLSRVSYDPEGLLGTLTSIFLCFLGLQAGKILLLHTDWKRRTRRWILWCVVTGVAAGGLCRFSQYEGWVPLNKNLWSVSFIFAMASMSFFLLTACYILIDVVKVWSGAPFLYPGMNSIVIYLGHEILSLYFPVQFSVASTHAAQLAMALWGATLWTIVAAIMYYKKITIAI